MRKTFFSAGYDMAAAEDVIVPSYSFAMDKIMETNDATGVPFTLEAIKKAIKNAGVGCNPTLIPTGYKCRINGNQFIQLSIRSSSPLKYWLILANGVGIIDADY
jgi:dUTP pyrophosphatase